MAWRVPVCKVWCVLWKTHNKILAYIAVVMNLDYFLGKMCIRIIKIALVSENCTVRAISNMGWYGSHSIMGANLKYLNTKYCMDESNVYSIWKEVSRIVCKLKI